MDAVVVGGGPAGSYASYLLSKEGFRVLLMEEHQEIGHPVQCAGLINTAVKSLPGLASLPDHVIQNRVNRASVHSEGRETLKIVGKDEKSLVVDRGLFDQHLAHLSASEGTEYWLKCRGEGVKVSDEGARVIYRKGGEAGEVEADLVVVAEGSAGRLSREIFGCGGEILTGLSLDSTVKGLSTLEEEVHLFLGPYAPGFFAWAIPLGSGGIRVGLAYSSSSGLRLEETLGRFLREAPLDETLGVGGRRIEEGAHHMVAGSIPIGPPKEIMKERVLALGDSSRMAKPTTGGGVYPALMTSSTLLNTLIKMLEGELNPKSASRRVNSLWRGGTGKELRNSMRLRHLYLSLSEHEIERIMEALSREDIQRYISEKGDIDKPFRLALGIYMRSDEIRSLVRSHLRDLRGLLI